MTSSVVMTRATIGGASTEFPLPPHPVVPPNPVETGLPDDSSAITAQGDILDYLSLPVTCASEQCKGITVKAGGKPIVGLIDTRGKQHSSMSVSGYWGQLLFTFMVDPASKTAAGSKLVEKSYWMRIEQDIVPANVPYKLTYTLNSGISQTDTVSFAYTLGAKIGGSYSGITAELSASLTKSFSHSVTINEQETVSREFSTSVQPYAQIVGIYQLVEEFAVIPGANLSQYMSKFNKTYGPGGEWCALTRACMKCAESGGILNRTPTYLQVVAHDETAANSEGTPILSLAEIDDLVTSSITIVAP